MILIHFCPIFPFYSPGKKKQKNFRILQTYHLIPQGFTTTLSLLTFTCLKSTIEALVNGVKHF